MIRESSMMPGRSGLPDNPPSRTKGGAGAGALQASRLKSQAADGPRTEPARRDFGETMAQARRVAEQAASQRDTRQAATQRQADQLSDRRRAEAREASARQPNDGRPPVRSAEADRSGEAEGPGPESPDARSSSQDAETAKREGPGTPGFVPGGAAVQPTPQAQTFGLGDQPGFATSTAAAEASLAASSKAGSGQSGSVGPAGGSLASAGLQAGQAASEGEGDADLLKAGAAQADGAAAASDAAPSASAGGTDISQTDSKAGPMKALSDFAERLALVGSSATQGAGAAGASATAAPTSPSGVPVHVTTLATAPGQPDFALRFADESVSLALAGVERAEITLTPNELGPVRIELSLNGESARVAFSATQPETRQAIEQSLPILKDMFAEHGLLLSDASVSDQARHDSRDGKGAGGSAGAPEQAGGRGLGSMGGPDRSETTPVRRTPLRGLLDLYA